VKRPRIGSVWYGPSLDEHGELETIPGCLHVPASTLRLPAAVQSVGKAGVTLQFHHGVSYGEAFTVTLAFFHANYRLTESARGKPVRKAGNSYTRRAARQAAVRKA
jgi:hypothetical protein